MTFPNRRIVAAQKQLEKNKGKQAEAQLKLDNLISEKLTLEKRQAALNAIPKAVTRQAWCADFTRKTSGLVGTIEVPDEPGTVLVLPGAPTPVAADGELVARAAQKSYQVYYNAAILPGVQRHRPGYRLGTLLSVDYAKNLGTVQLAPATSSAQGLNVNQKTTVDVDFYYMECNAAAFKAGDQVVLWFPFRDWELPIVIGFKSEPRKCAQPVLYSVYTKSADGFPFGRLYQRATLATPWGGQAGATFESVDQWERPLSNVTATRPFFVPDGYGAWVGSVNESDIYIQSAAGQTIRLDHPIWLTYPRDRFVLEMPNSPFHDCDVIKNPSGGYWLLYWNSTYQIDYNSISSSMPGDPPIGAYVDPKLYVFDLSVGFATGTCPLVASKDFGYIDLDVRVPLKKYLASDGQKYAAFSNHGSNHIDIYDVATLEIVASHFMGGAIADAFRLQYVADAGTIAYCWHTGPVEEWPPVNYRIERRDILSWELVGLADIQVSGSTDFNIRFLTLIGNMVFWREIVGASSPYYQRYTGTQKVHGVQLMQDGSGEQFSWDAPDYMQDHGESFRFYDLMMGK